MYYYDEIIFDNDKYILISSEKGLVFIGVDNGLDKKIYTYMTKFNPIKNKEKLRNYTERLQGYFQGNRKKFVEEFDLQGTDFQKEVWNELFNLKYGEYISYKELAERLGKPKSVRAVANAVGQNPLLIFIPCHRVVGSSGKLTGFRSGLELKKKLLELEGIKI